MTFPARKWALHALWVACMPGALPTAQAQESVRAVTETTPYTYVEGGKVAGTAAKVVELTLQRAQLPYSIHLYPWARAYDMAQKEPGVLIFLIARTPAREAQFQWAGEIMKMEYHLYRLRSHPLSVPDLASAKDYTIGVMRDDVRQQYLREKGFTKLVVSAQPIDNFRKLLSGQVDMVPLTADDATMLCKETKSDCANLDRVLTLTEASAGLYMAYSPSTPQATVERTRKAFEQLKAEGVVERTLQRPASPP